MTVRPEDSVEHAAQLMYFLKVKRMPVVDADGGLVGLVSRADVLAVYDRPDDDIREEITGNVIVRGFGEDPRKFAVTVQAGRMSRPNTIGNSEPLTSRVSLRTSICSGNSSPARNAASRMAAPISRSP